MLLVDCSHTGADRGSRIMSLVDTSHRSFCDTQTATYNVNGRASSKVDLSDWLKVRPVPDIVAVGFQEIVPLNASNVVFGERTRILVIYLSF